MADVIMCGLCLRERINKGANEIAGFGYVCDECKSKYDRDKNKVLKILEEKDKAREQRIKEIKAMKLPDWEKKLMLKATKSATWGW